MNATFQRSLTGHYMILEGDASEPEDSYEMKILAANRIPGLLTAEPEYMNGRISYRYDVTRLIPLDLIWNTRDLSGRGVRQLFSDLADSLDTFDDYLLNTDHLLFSPEYLFSERSAPALRIPYVPFYQKELRSSLLELTEYILLKIGRTDEESVVLTCRILRELQREDFVLGDLRSLLEKAPAEQGGEDVRTGSFRFRDGEEHIRDGEEHIRAESFRFRDGQKPGQPEQADTPLKRDGFTGIHSFREPLPAEAGSASGTDPGQGIPGRKRSLKGGHGKHPERRGKHVSALRKNLIPEKGTLRLAAFGAVPAALLFLLLRMRKILVLTLTETVGTGLLFAAVLLLIIHLRDRRRTKKNAGTAPAATYPAYGGISSPGLPDEPAVFHPGPAGKDIFPGETEASGWNEASGWADPSGRAETFRVPEDTTVLSQSTSFTETALLAESEATGGSRASLIPEDRESGLPVICLAEGNTMIGKQAGAADAVIADETISRIHAEIATLGSSSVIRDCSSRNGTSVNGRLLAGGESCPLTDGDVVAFSRCRYVFRQG